MTLPSGVGRRTVECPECGAIRSYTYHKDVKYFKAKPLRCHECDYVGQRGTFKTPEY